MPSLHSASILHRLSQTRRSIACAAMLGLFTAPLGAQLCDSLERRNTRQSVNLGSGWSVPIVANPGHLPESVAFTALGATETAYRFHHSGAVELLLPSGATTMVHALVGDAETSALSLLAETPQDATQRWLTSEGDYEMVAYGALSVDMEPGLTARHQVHSRLLRTTYNGPWQDLGLRVDGLVDVGPQGADGSLPLNLEAGSLRLYAATYREGDAQRRLPFRPDGDGVLRLDPDALDGVADALPLQVVWETAPYFHRYDAIVGAGGDALAVTTTVGATNGLGRDILVLGLDLDGVPTFSTVLASSGDDRASALTISSAEQLYIAGWQDQPGLALDGQSRKAAGPFLVRLGRDGNVVDGRYLLGDGLAAVHDIAVDAEDRLVISGHAAGKRTSEAEPLPLELTVPTSEDAAVGDVLVLELDTEMQPTGRRSQVVEVALDTRLEVRPACGHVLAIGPKPVTAAQTSCTGNLVTDTYQADNPNPSNFFDGAVNAGSPDDPWGWHALRWKRETQLAHAYTPPTVAPFLTVNNGDHTQLDNLEQNTSVFATEPAGSWLLNTTISAEETAIGAALYMDFWTSPSYANLKLSTEFLPRPAALMEVEFCVDAIGSNNSVTDYCAASAASQGIFTPRYPIDEIDRLCNIQYGFGMINIRHVDIDHWAGGTSFTQSTRLIQPVFRSAVDDAGTLHQHYIADPPDGAVADGLITEAARRMSGHAVRAVPTTTYRVLDDGSVEPLEDGEGWVPALSEMAAAP